jgi:hypothetical protein
MNELEVVYQDRVLKITRLVPHESNKYKIERLMVWLAGNGKNGRGMKKRP